MPATWDMLSKQLGFRANPFDARSNIMFSAYYSRYLYRQWSAKRTDEEYRRWTFASYNSGLGTVLSAQRYVSGSIYYRSIEPYLPAETRDYVIKIEYHHRTTFQAIYKDRTK